MNKGRVDGQKGKNEGRNDGWNRKQKNKRRKSGWNKQRIKERRMYGIRRKEWMMERWMDLEGKNKEWKDG